MKPIEAGCLAMIIKSRCPENVGKVVKCIKRYLKGDKISYMAPSYNSTGEIVVKISTALWSVEGDIKTTLMDNNGGIVAFTETIILTSENTIEANSVVNEKWLMRIDGFEEDESNEVGRGLLNPVVAYF